MKQLKHTIAVLGLAILLLLPGAPTYAGPPPKDYGPGGGGGGSGIVVRSVRVGNAGKAKPSWTQAMRAVSRRSKGTVVTRGDIYKGTDGSWQVKVVRKP